VNSRGRFAVRAFLCGLLAAGFTLVAIGPVKATPPPIVWGSPQTVSGDSDVSTTGSLVYAFTFGGASAPSSATVNGVTFLPFTIPSGAVTSATTGNVVISESPFRLFGSNSFGTASTPFSGLSNGYQAMLGSGAYADSSLTITVTLNGLTNGQQYQLQWWTNNSSNILSIFGDSFSNTTATAINSVTLDANTTNTIGGIGQYAIGTFTATGTTQAFQLSEVSGGINPLINALQVRAVPEPSTYGMALAGLACGGLSMFRRRKRA